MNQRTLTLLEFPDVLALLAEHAASEPGREACLAIAPLQGAEAVRRENRTLDEAMAWLARSEYAPADFPPLEGLLAFLRKPSGVLDLDDLVALKAVLAHARRALDAFGDPAEAARRGDDHAFPLLSAEAWATAWPGMTASGVKRCVSDMGQLKDESSPQLMAARAAIREVHSQCLKKVKAWVLENNLTHYLQDDYVTIASDRYVLPMKSSFKTKLPGVIHDYSQTGETCYFEPLFLVDLNNSAQELRQEERQAERQVLELLTGFAREEAHAIEDCYRLLVRLDVLAAKTGLAAQLDAVPLEVAPGAPVDLRAARHPLLAADPRARTQPLDIVLPEGRRGLLVSGGNAGGKTVCLKTLGLAAVMAMAGLPVPAARGGSLPLWERCFVFMGDEQSLADHVSTFTAQIERLASSLQAVDDASLVLLDEFGAGTDPAQGAALAQAVIETLLDKGAFVAAATHFPGLKVFALADERVRPASVLFDPATKKPLYRLAYDQVGQSQALDAARDHGLPEPVLARAEAILNPSLEGADSSHIIEQLNELAVARERELDDLRREKARLADRETKLRERFEKHKDALEAEIRSLSRRVLKEWQERKASHKQALRELAEARRTVTTADGGLAPEHADAGDAAAPARNAGGDTAQAPALEDIAKGQAVRYRPWGKQATVEEVDAKRKLVKVDIQGVSLWAKPQDLGVSQQPAISGPSTGGGRAKPAQPKAAGATGGIGARRVDLRGKRGDEAVAALGKAIDDALMRDVSQLEVVHGKGTGALRREVHAFLRNSPVAASFDLASEEHGGDGVTIVELK